MTYCLRLCIGRLGMHFEGHYFPGNPLYESQGTARSGSVGRIVDRQGQINNEHKDFF